MTYTANIHLYLVNERGHLQSSLSGRLHPSLAMLPLLETLLLDKTLSAAVAFSERL